MMVQATQPPMARDEIFRTQCIRWIADFRPNLFVTFVFNRKINICEAQQALEKFHGQLDRKLVGRAFLRRPDRRSTYIATVEKPDANIHIHALFKLTETQKLRFCLVANDVWAGLIKGGNLDVQPVHCAEGVADYITKELKPETSERLLLPRHMENATSR